MLNKEQKEAVEHEFGPCFVAACPGSGKTTIIVERIMKLIAKGHDARNILCITFTNKAAKEMKERVTKKLGDVGQNVYITTFHALCATIIRKYGSYIGYDITTTILDDDDQEGLMSQCARQAGYELTKQQIKNLLTQVNNMRESLIDENEFEDHVQSDFEAKIIYEYLDRMRKSKQIDFSGLLSETIRLLKSDAEVLSKLQQRFEFVQVDETQDTNFAQFRIVELLGAHNNIMLVGDSDQSIYNWRGARYQNIIDFIDNKKAKVIPLPENYRSTPQIIKVADTLIKHNKSRQHTIEFRTSNPSGEDVECFCLPSPEHEGMWIAHKIQELFAKGYGPKDIAVLYRLNSMSRSIEQGLINQGIPYEVIGGFSFYDRTEVKDCLSLLRFVVNKNDGMALSRFINKPTARIGETTIGKIENYARENSCTLLDALAKSREIITTGADRSQIYARCDKIAHAFKANFDKMSIGEVLTHLLTEIDYHKYLKSKFDDKELQDKLGNVQETVNGAALYSSQKGNDVGAYVNNIALQSSSDKEVHQDCVSLMSLHASKGLEFKAIFMPGLEDGQLPHARALAERDGLEEERRLCYVGFTRAKQRLFVSYANARMQKYRNGSINYQKTQPSRFLLESNLHKNVKVVNAR